jgi:hypothetical protein
MPGPLGGVDHAAPSGTDESQWRYPDPDIQMPARLAIEYLPPTHFERTVYFWFGERH